MKAFTVVLGICALIGIPAHCVHAQDTTRVQPTRVVRPRVAQPDSLGIESSNIDMLNVGVMDELGATVRQAMRDSLAVQRHIWDSRRPASYVIRVLTIDHCIHVRTGVRGTTMPRVTVIGDRLVKREEAPIPRSYTSHCWHEWTVEDLFSDLARSIGDSSRTVGGIQYDPAYGFPRYYWRALSGRPAGVMVESFAPAP